MNGRTYWLNAKGSWIPLEVVKVVDQLEDGLVRKLFEPARELAAKASAFRERVFGDIEAFNVILADLYGAKATIGGEKGNITLATYDGTMRIQVQISDVRRFNAAIQVAKKLVDECLNGWLEGANAKLAVIVNDAFQVDQEGKINHGKIFALLRYEITDEPWLRAMDAIRDSIVVESSKRHLRFHWRPTPNDSWRHLTLDGSV